VTWVVELDVLRRGGTPERRRVVADEMIVVGRSKLATLHLPDANVARKHCSLTVTDAGDVLVSDLQSTNGTYVDGVRVGTNRLLVVGEEIYVGDYLVRFAGVSRA
jgi:pSer/pThr/pTyr-binding forkhead associated (FHA) protein